MMCPPHLQCCLKVQDPYVIEAFINEFQHSCDTIGNVFDLNFNICFTLVFLMLFYLYLLFVCFSIHDIVWPTFNSIYSNSQEV